MQEVMNKVQAQMTERRTALQHAQDELNALHQQRTVLELTDEQKRAIQSLVRRQPSAREILTSTDFWFGRVLVSAVFLAFGIIIGRWMRRFDKPSLVTGTLPPAQAE
jgi:small-conductance mechanosensitive channel